MDSGIPGMNHPLPVSDQRLPLPVGPGRGTGTVTAIVVARNEESTIGECLKRLLWADRILVIDNGSTDRTAEVARSFTAWIVPHEPPAEIDPVHGGLNFGFEMIPDGWILQIDADERASRRLGPEIRETIGATRHEAFRVPFRIALLGRWLRSGYWGQQVTLIRLFRAGRASYPLHSVHESVNVAGTVGTLQAPIYHLPYLSIADFLKKTNRYTSRETSSILKGLSPGMGGMGRKAAHPSGARILWVGVRLFLWSFFRLGGWREGRIGLATSALLGTYGFLELLKVWERAEGLTGEIELPEDDNG